MIKITVDVSTEFEAICGYSWSGYSLLALCMLSCEVVSSGALMAPNFRDTFLQSSEAQRQRGGPPPRLGGGLTGFVRRKLKNQ